MINSCQFGEGELFSRAMRAIIFCGWKHCLSVITSQQLWDMGFYPSAEPPHTLLWAKGFGLVLNTIFYFEKGSSGKE